MYQGIGHAIMSFEEYLLYQHLLFDRPNTLKPLFPWKKASEAIFSRL